MKPSENKTVQTRILAYAQEKRDDHDNGVRCSPPRWMVSIQPAMVEYAQRKSTMNGALRNRFKDRVNEWAHKLGVGAKAIYIRPKVLAP
jgi:hypothetical protein